MNPRRRRYLYSFVPLLIGLICAEIGLRLAGFSYESFLGRDYWWNRSAINPIYEKDPARFWRLRPFANRDADEPTGQITQLINGDGFRDDPAPREKQPGEYRVIAVGDSCTFGDGVAGAQTYANVLESLLRQALPGRPVQVINAGVPGYTSFQVRRYLERELWRWQPDLVVVYVGFNDFVPAANGVTDAERAAVSRFTWIAQSTLDGLRSYQWLNFEIAGVKQRLFPNRKATGTEVDGNAKHPFRVPYPELIHNLEAIDRLGNQKGFCRLLLTLPHQFKDEPMANLYIRYAASKNQIPLLDLFSALKVDQEKGEALFGEDGGHPNALGHRRIAEAIFARLQQNGFAACPPGKAGVDSMPVSENGRPDDQSGVQSE